MKHVKVSYVESLLDVQPIHRTNVQEDAAALQLFTEVINKTGKLKGVFELATPDYELVLTPELVRKQGK